MPTGFIDRKPRIRAKTGFAIGCISSTLTVDDPFKVGIDNNGTKFLLAAAAAGASFRRTAMLGRQNFFPNPRVLQEVLDARRPGENANRFLTESEGYAEKFFHFLGAEEVVAIDNSDYEGAEIVADMNAPSASELKNRFSAIFDGGCLEHVFNFPQAIRNCMEMLSLGGHFIAVTPANNFCGHGFYQFSPELFFRIFSKENGFQLRTMVMKEGARWYRVVDPQVHGGRVELLNARPTYLFVLAKKIATRKLLVQPPQQSDYATRWKLPSSVNLKEKLRPYAANISVRHRYPCYVRMDERALLRGELDGRNSHFAR